jgi:hypothetical protein
VEGETNLWFLCETLSRFGVEMLTGLFVTPLLDMLLDGSLTNTDSTRTHLRLPDTSADLKW